MKTLIAFLFITASTFAQVTIPAAPEPPLQVVTSPRVLLSASASKVILDAGKTLTGQSLAAAGNLEVKLLGSGSGATCHVFVITGLPAAPKSTTLPETGVFNASKTTEFVKSVLPAINLADWATPIDYYAARLIHSGSNTGKIEVSVGYLK